MSSRGRAPRRNLLVGLVVVARGTDDHELQRRAACIRERVHFAEIDRDGVAGFDGRRLGRRASPAGPNRYCPFTAHNVIEFGLLRMECGRVELPGGSSR